MFDNSVPFLGKLPLQPAIREGGDEGRPFLLAYPRAPESEAYRAVAGALARQVSLLAYEKGPGEGFVPLDAQGEVMVKVEEGAKTVTGHGSDTDIIVASAKAYLNALNKLAYWKSRKDEKISYKEA